VSPHDAHADAGNAKRPQATASNLVTGIRGSSVPDDPRFGYALHLGDNALVLAQRLGEWVGHAPELEEDLAFANIALDLIGQARYLFSYAAQLEGRGRSEDDLAFRRDPGDFMNLNLVEQPNRDFGYTIVRQFLFAAWQLELFQCLQTSRETRLAELAAKALKETRYHWRFSAGWLVRLGDGTQESHRRVQDALDDLWRFTHELFTPGDIDQAATHAELAPNVATLRTPWLARVEPVLQEGTLIRPADVTHAWHGKQGRHSEHLGHLLVGMQYLQRTYPGAQW